MRETGVSEEVSCKCYSLLWNEIVNSEQMEHGESNLKGKEASSTQRMDSLYTLECTAAFIDPYSLIKNTLVNIYTCVIIDTCGRIQHIQETTIFMEYPILLSTAT